MEDDEIMLLKKLYAKVIDRIGNSVNIAIRMKLSKDGDIDINYNFGSAMKSSRGLKSKKVVKGKKEVKFEGEKKKKNTEWEKPEKKHKKYEVVPDSETEFESESSYSDTD
jgi:hypothetical protein